MKVILKVQGVKVYNFGTLVLLVASILLVKDRCQRRVLVNVVMNCRVPEKARYF
jgi:hypothetical protein